MEEGDSEKRQIWAKVIQSRSEKGYPYIFFTDNVNNGAADVYRDKEMKIYSSNLCSEICLPTSKDWSFVCDLSSLNLTYYDEWKDTDAVETLTYFLDAVMTEFINKVEELPDRSKSYMSKALSFAKENRALGIGVFGWHTYLQEHSIAFEDPQAISLNKEVWENIREKAYNASESL